jgi:hypothetical protein
MVIIMDNELENNLDKFRFERKFFIFELSVGEVESIIRLHPAIFSEIYHPRYINNIYLDSFGNKSYFDNVDGHNDRAKFRIRWYGKIFGNIKKPVLEKKVKKGLLGSKSLFLMNPISVDENLTIDTIKNTLRDSKIPDDLKFEVICLKPVMLNHYRRKYFQSADGNYRITMDSGLLFYRINCYNNSFQHKIGNNLAVILELKYDSDNDNSADSITNHFPFRMTKSSKYVEGIEKLYLI